MAPTGDFETEAQDPNTEPERLAEIAQEHPTLRPTIALNPSAYTGLLEWLAEHGDEATRAALEQRRRSLVSTPVPPPPPPPSAATADRVAMAVQGGDATSGVPSIPKGEAPRKSRSRKALFGIAGAVAVVLAAGTAAAMILPNLSPASSRSEISTVDLMKAPKEAWSIDHPLAPQVSENGYVTAQGVTVGQDRALVEWACCGDENAEPKESRLSLVDTRTGKTKWEVPWKHEIGSLVSLPGTSNPIVSTADGLISIDLANGALLSNSTKLTVIGTAPELNGDVIAKDQATGAVGRYAPGDLKKSIWSVSNPSGSSFAIAGGMLVGGTDAYSIVDGTKASWSADSSSEYGELGGQLLRVSDLALTGVDTSTGSDTWTVGLRGKEIIPLQFSTNAVLIIDRGAGTASLLNPKDGTLSWTADVTVAAENPNCIEWAEAGVIWIQSSGDADQFAAIDVATGEKLYSYKVDQDADNVSRYIGSSKSNLYFVESKSGEMSAVDIRTGQLRWAMKPPEGLYELQIWGGNLIAVLNNGDSDSSEKFVIGLAP